MKWLIVFLPNILLLAACSKYEERHFAIRRLSKIIYEDGRQVEFKFNQKGQPISKLETTETKENFETYSYLENGQVDQIFEHWYARNKDSGGVWKYHYNDNSELIKRTYHSFSINTGLSEYFIIDSVLKVKGQKIYEIKSFYKHPNTLWFTSGQTYSFTIDGNIKNRRFEEYHPTGGRDYEIKYQYDRKPYFALHNPAYENFINVNRNNIIKHTQVDSDEITILEYKYDDYEYPVLTKLKDRVIMEFFYE